METVVLYIISVAFGAAIVILFRENKERSKNSQVKGELLVELRKEVDNIKELLKAQIEINREFSDIAMIVNPEGKAGSKTDSQVKIEKPRVFRSEVLDDKKDK